MQTIRAILLMILSMALLALSDLFIKLSAREASQGQIAVLLSGGGVCLYLLLARFQGIQILTRDFFHPMVMLRNLFEIIAAVALVFALSYVPLTTFSAIVQVAPILVVMGGALFLNEQVGWRRWAAVMVGLVGMLLVIRPGGAETDAYIWLAVLGVSGLAARDLVTRLSPAHIPALALSTWGFASNIPVGFIILAFQGGDYSTDGLTLFYILCTVLVTSFGYLAITMAMRMAPVSIVAPFRYTRLIFTAGLGIVIFDERPDALTWLGAAIILAAGLYTFLRERRLALAADAALAK